MEGQIMGPSVSYAILCAGDFPARSEVLGALLSCDVSVCCDSAAGSLLAYRRPDFVVGDMDSLSQRLRDELSDRVFEVSEQESNDMSKAFRLVCSVLGIGGSVPVPEFSITVFGATGRREDHTLGNISLLADFACYLKDEGACGRIAMLTDYGMFVPVLDTCSLSLPAGQPLSLFSFDPGLRIVSSGLQYPTGGVVFDMWWKATLNKACGGAVRLEFSRPAKVLLYLPGMYDSTMEITG